jgi:hypothetical protein
MGFVEDALKNAMILTGGGGMRNQGFGKFEIV